MGKWIKAEKKQVVDGPNSKSYLSGIHFFSSISSLKKYTVFNHPAQVICRIRAEGVRRKTWARVPVFLADQIMILELVEIIREEEK